MLVLLHYMQLGLVGKAHLAEQIFWWLLFLFQPFPLFVLLLAELFFSISHPFPVVQRFMWVGRWSSPGFSCIQRGHPLRAVALIACSGPRQHPPAFSCCSAIPKISNVHIQITKIIKLSLTEILNLVLFLFFTSVAATLHNTCHFCF